jgi:H+/Cl- antiporter ClcA
LTDATPPVADDPIAVLRSRPFVGLLALAAVVGVAVSVLAWGFLELVHDIQQLLFVHLPSGLGFDDMPWWWPLPILIVAGFPVAYAQTLPGGGGHIPANGLKVSATTPNMLPGILIAAVASLGLGVVLGPEAPLIALGGGCTVLVLTQLKKDAPQRALLVLGAAGSFAAISMIFESPVVAAVLVIEATGLGGPTLPLVLLPGLLSAGMGSLTFIGISHWTGLDTSAYSMSPLSLPDFPAPTWADIGWSVLLAVAAAVVVFGVRRIGLAVATLPPRRPYVVVPAAGAVVALLAIVFAQLSDHGVQEVLFSGQDTLPGVVANPGAWSAGALGLVVVCKGLAWAVSLGSFRGGPTFPALYIGAAGGLLASHLPGLAVTPGVAVGMTAMAASMLRLPLSSIVIATALTLPAGAGSAPLIIVAAVTSYLVTIWLSAHDTPDAAPATPSAQKVPVDADA